MLIPGPIIIKLLTVVIYKFVYNKVVFVLVRPFRCSSLGRLLALPTIIRLCYIGLPDTNNLASKENL
jgi:hypothetical protein